MCILFFLKTQPVKLLEKNIKHALVYYVTDMGRWHVGDVTIESSSGAQSLAFCNAWVSNPDGSDTHGRTFDCTATKGRSVSIASLAPVKYDVTVVTADEKGEFGAEDGLTYVLT